MKLLILLNKEDRKKALKITGLIAVMATMDALGVASILPFMAVLAKPSIIDENLFLSGARQALNFSNPHHFNFLLGILTLILFLLSNSIKSIVLYQQSRFLSGLEHSFGSRLLENYLSQSYSWYLDKNSSDLTKVILSEVSNVVGGAYVPLLTCVSQGAVSLAIIALLMFIDPTLAAIIFSILCIVFGLIYKSTRSFLQKIGSERLVANKLRFKAVSELFGGFREVKLGGLEVLYLKKYEVPSNLYSRHQSSSQIVAQLPRLIIEGIAYGGILIFLLVQITESGSFATSIPMVALYAFAGYRLMPAFQNIYSSASQLRFSDHSISLLYDDLVKINKYNINIKEKENDKNISINNSIVLEDVCFRYGESKGNILNKININIPIYGMVGIVGPTGSGKTTVLDMILGLIEPNTGKVKIDNFEINSTEQRRNWQKIIGYVPQQIYLTDDSIAANIAFGVDSQKIDIDAVIWAAKIANIDNFITNELDKGYSTIVGERGVRLSGGQRQRIGIARALYKMPQVLILDEATSALDNITESNVIEAIKNSQKKMTIIIVAHRISTVVACNKIYYLENGEISDSGTYEELLVSNKKFRTMANLIH